MLRRPSMWVAVGATVLGAAPAQAQSQTVHRIAVEGVIELGLAPFVARALREAEESGARAIVLEIETPGGRVDAAQQIVKAITESGISVYAFVNAHAWSAGAMIALATDSIFMGPNSSIGAATPVGGDGQKAPEKINSALRGEFRALAQRKGIDPALAEAMVDEEVVVEGVVAAGKLLTLTAAEAVQVGVAEAEVESYEDLLEEVGIEAHETVVASINWAERLVRFLSNPVVAPILLSMGTLGLIIEIKTPSFGIAGFIGLASFTAFFGSHLIVGLAGWEELLLLGVGMVALGIEVFVTPGFGIAGVISGLSISAAIFLALLGNIPTWGDVTRASGILSVTLGMVIVAVYLLVRHLPTSARWQGIFLSAATDRATGYIAAETRTDLVGTEGTTATDLHPSGVAVVGSERIDVVSNAGFVPKGARVRVVRSDGYRHVVEPVEDVATA